MLINLFPGTVLRDATLLDIERLIFLEKSLDDVVGHMRWGIARWVYEIHNNNVWVVENGPGLTGLIYCVGWFRDGNTADVIKLVASAVGKSLTARVFEVGMELVKKEGIRKVRGRSAAGLLIFYERLGFKNIGELPNYYGLDISGYSIEKDLDLSLVSLSQEVV